MCDCEALLDLCEQCFDPLLCKIGRQKKEAPTIECVRTLVSSEVEQEKEGFVLAVEKTAQQHPSVGSNGISFVQGHGGIGFETSFDYDESSSLRNSNKDCCVMEEENLEGQHDANDESKSLTKKVSEKDSEKMSHVERGGIPSNKDEAMMGGEEAVTICEAVCDVVAGGASGEEVLLGDTVGVAAVGEAVCGDVGDAVGEALDEAMGKKMGAVYAAGVTTKSDEEGMIRSEKHIVELVSEKESESGDEEIDRNLDTSDDDASIVQRQRQIEKMRAHVEMRLESLLKSNSLVGLREQVRGLRKSGSESESVVHKEEICMDKESFEEEDLQESSAIIESKEMPRDPHDSEKMTAHGNPEACCVHSKGHTAENVPEEAYCGIQSKNAIGKVVGDTIGVIVVEAVGEGVGDTVGEHVGDEESHGSGVTETETHFEGKVSNLVGAPTENNGYETALKEKERYDDRSENYISKNASVDEKNGADANPTEADVQEGEKRPSLETVSEQDGYETALEKKHFDDCQSKTFFSGNASVDRKNGTASTKNIATNENPAGVEQGQEDARSETFVFGNASVDDEKNGTQKTNPKGGDGIQSESRVSEMASFYPKAAAEADCAVAPKNKSCLTRPYLVVILLLFHSILSMVVIAFLLWNQYTKESLASSSWRMMEQQEFVFENVKLRRAFVVPNKDRFGEFSRRVIGNIHWKTALQEFRRPTGGAASIRAEEQ